MRVSNNAASLKITRPSSLTAMAAQASRLAEARRDAYRFFSRCYLDAPPETSEGIALLAETLVEVLAGIADDEVNALAEALLATEPGALWEDYQRLLAVVTGRNLVPVESAYEHATLEQGEWRMSRLRSAPWHAVRKAYREAGFEVLPSAHVESDHLAVELDFLAAICAREAAGWRDGDLDQAEAARERALDFLEAHPQTWVRRLRQRTADLAETTWYRDLPRLLERFLATEAEFLRPGG